VSSSNLAPVDISLEGIGHLVKDRRLSVPPYQRGYAWGEEQVEDFWWDLKASFGTPIPQYFLGTVVLAGGSRGGSATIIDGQQRLTTASLLLTALRDEFSHRGDEDRARVLTREYLLTEDIRSGSTITRLTLNAADQTAYAAVVSQPHNDIGTSGAAGRRITEALAYLRTQVAREATAAGPRWADTLFRWIDFVEHSVRVIAVTVADDADAFLIFETLNARGRDLTVSDLLKNYLFGVAGQSLPALQAHWEAALQSLEVTADEELFTTFLRHYWSSVHGATRERELFARIKAKVSSTNAALALGRALDEASPAYAALLSADHSFWEGKQTEQSCIETLNRLGLEQLRPMLLAGLLHFNAKEMERLLRATVSWSVRGLIVGGIGGGKTERAYAEAGVAISAKTIRSTDEVYKELLSVLPTDEVFRSAFAQRRVTRLSLAKYLLVSLARHEAEQPSPTLIGDIEDGMFRISGIIPRKAPPAHFPRFPAEELQQWQARLGNLYVTPSLVEAPSATTPPAEAFEGKWTPALLDARQERMADLAVLLWPRQLV
jgi:hypothetical protein